jgi:hypothetical protein
MIGGGVGTSSNAPEIRDSQRVRVAHAMTFEGPIGYGVQCIRGFALQAVTVCLAAFTLGDSIVAAADAPASGQHTSPAVATRIYLGMWTAHVRNVSSGLDPNSLLGVAYRGYYGATFINSYGNRALSAGIQRTVVPGRPASTSRASSSAAAWNRERWSSPGDLTRVALSLKDRSTERSQMSLSVSIVSPRPAQPVDFMRFNFPKTGEPE